MKGLPTCNVVYEYTFLFWSKVSWVTVKFLWAKVPCTLGWPYTEGNWLYCDYVIWCVSCTVVVLTCSVMCVCLYTGVFQQLCGCFDNMSTFIYCVLYCLYCVFCIFRLCIFILISLPVVMITATEWKLSFNSSSNNKNNKFIISFIRNSVLRQFLNLIKSQSSTQYKLLLPLSIHSKF
jgi:hypothetical protein